MIKERDMVWSNRSILKDSTLIIREDMPGEMEQNVRTLLPAFREAKSLKIKVSLNRDTLKVNGDKFTVKHMSQLPTQLRPEFLANKVTEQQHFFYGKQSKLSNFYACSFNDGYQSFNCQDQYYAYRKATHFRDFDARKQILKSVDPVEIKRIKIANFSQNIWAEEEDQAMENGLMFKFMQNPELEDYLLATEEKELIEANHRDNHWGIGCGLKSPLLSYRSKWGENKLDKALMKGRDRPKQRKIYG